MDNYFCMGSREGKQNICLSVYERSSLQEAKMLTNGNGEARQEVCTFVLFPKLEWYNIASPR